jgi:hypothetical protein
MKYANHVTPSYPLSNHTFWKHNGLILSLVVGFFGRLPTWIGIYFAFNRCSFRNHVNMALLMCKSKGKCLVISLSYHICISFILNPLLYNIMYSSWLASSYSCPSFTVFLWSYHWQSEYPFTSMPLHESTYSSPQYISKYYHNYCFGKWNTCSKGGLPPFLLPHLMTSGYPYHKKWLLDLNGHCHYWLNLDRYGATNINDDNTCNNDGCLRKNTIICWVSIRK